MSRFKKDIPDRWLDYKGIGDKIAGTPFVAFKVPLHRVSSLMFLKFSNWISKTKNFNLKELTGTV